MKEFETFKLEGGRFVFRLPLAALALSGTLTADIIIECVRNEEVDLTQVEMIPSDPRKLEAEEIDPILTLLHDLQRECKHYLIEEDNEEARERILSLEQIAERKIKEIDTYFARPA